VNEHEVEHVGAQAAQAPLHAPANGIGREIVSGNTAFEELAYLGGEEKFASTMGDRLSDAFLTPSVGGGGVDVVDAQVENSIEERGHGGGVGEFVRSVVLRPQVAADLEGAVSQG